jgi:hypothetical protein
MLLRFVADGTQFGPTGTDVGHTLRERTREIAAGITTVMLHQVPFDETRSFVIPVREGANGNVLLEQGARLGTTTSPHVRMGQTAESDPSSRH